MKQNKQEQKEQIKSILQKVHDDAVSDTHDPGLGYSERAVELLQDLITQSRQEAKIEASREIIDAYKKNTGIDDDLFTQFLEVMYDYNLELSSKD